MAKIHNVCVAIVLLFTLIMSCTQYGGDVNVEEKSTPTYLYITPTGTPIPIEQLPTEDINPKIMETDNTPTFLVLTKNIIDELNKVAETLGMNLNGDFYRVIKEENIWKITLYNGDAIFLETVDGNDGTTTVIIDTTDLAGKKSVFSVKSSDGSVLMLLILGKDDPFYFFAPSSDQFVVCPYHSTHDWYCSESGSKVFDFKGPAYIRLLISENGEVTWDLTEKQFENVISCNGLNIDEVMYDFDLNQVNYKDCFCALENQENINYKIPGDDAIYTWGYKNCQNVDITQLQ